MKDVTNNKYSDNSINSKQKYIQLNKKKKKQNEHDMQGRIKPHNYNFKM